MLLLAKRIFVKHRLHVLWEELALSLNERLFLRRCRVLKVLYRVLLDGRRSLVRLDDKVFLEELFATCIVAGGVGGLEKVPLVLLEHVAFLEDYWHAALLI